MSAWPVSSCSSRASRARSSSCAATTRRIASRLTRSERSTATEARCASDSASRRSSSVKTGVCPLRSWAMTTPIARPAGDERYVERRVDAEPPRCLVVDLRVVEHRVDALAPTALEHLARLRSGERKLGADDPVDLLAVRGRDAELAAVGERDQDESCVDELAEVPRDEPEERLELELGHERVADLVQRLELPEPARRALVQARVLDRDRCLRGEELGQLGVVLREPCAALLLGEVEVAVRNSPQQDRHAEERAHRRVPRQGSRPSAGRRRCPRAAAGVRPGSGRRGCPCRAAGHRSRPASPRRRRR